MGLKNIAAGIVSLMVLGGFSLSGATATLSGNLTADNQFKLYVSSDDNIAGDYLGFGNDWRSTYTFSYNLTEGQDYYLHINAEDIGGIAAFIGQFNLSGDDHVFANKQTSILTNTADWGASTTGWQDYISPSVVNGNNGVSPWGKRYAISKDATWIWSSDPQNDNAMYFTLGILSKTSTSREVLAFYQFEQPSWSGKGSVIDSSAGGNHGDPLGTASPRLPNQPKSCQALNVPANSSPKKFSGVNTQLKLDTDIGNRGTISFWYRSNIAWSKKTRRQLLDASTSIGSKNSKYFYLSLGSGELDFGLEDSADSGGRIRASNLNFAANEWVHIAVSYDYFTDSASIFVNGLAVGHNNALGLNGEIPDLSTLYIGDNRSSYLALGMTANSADGQFDDLRIYNFPQSAQNVKLDSDTLSPCEQGPYALYEFEQSQFNGPKSILDSANNLYHASPVGNVSPRLAGDQIACRYVDVAANYSAQHYAAIDTGVSPTNLGNNGTISFWYRSNLPWADNTARQLFDASTSVGSAQSKYFYLSLRSGVLDFGLEDSADKDVQLRVSGLNFAANEWVHIAVSYDYAKDRGVIFVNGAQVGRNDKLGLNGRIPSFNSLYLGDNRSDYVVVGMTANSANGQFDNLYLYAYAQDATQVTADKNRLSTCQAISHYQLEHDGQGLTCEAETVVIKACANTECSQFYTEPSSITLSPNGWQAEPLQFTGTITTTLSVLTAGSVSFSKRSAEPDVPLRCLTNGVQTCNMRFVDAGFEFFGKTLSDKFLPDQMAESPFVGAHLRAVQNNNGVCQALLQGEKDITLGVDCTSPNSCLTPFGDIDTTVTPDVESTGAIRLTFDSNGIASLNSMYYADAGRLTLRAQATIGGANIDSGLSSVDVLPTQLVLQAQPEVLLDNTANLGPYPAGEEFWFTLSAYGALNHKPLPNYQPGQLQMSATRSAPNSDVASHGQFNYASDGFITTSLAAPRVFEDTSLLTFVGGQYRFDSHYSEVGIISVQVRDGNYLEDNYNPQSIIQSSGELNLGAFRPAYLSVEMEPSLPPAKLENACGSFSYLGQAIGFASDPSFRLTGKNAQGEVTNNYTDNYWHYHPDVNNGIAFLDSSAYAAIGSAKIISSGSTAAQPEGWLDYDGSAKIVLVDSSFRYNKVNPNYQTYPLTEPFAASIDLQLSAEFLTDDDGACYQTNYPGGCETYPIAGITGTELHNGRLILEPSYGPEADFLRVPLKAQHYLNNRWQFNPADSCTDINMQQSQGQIVLTPVGENDITGDIEPVSSSGLLFEGLPLGGKNFALMGGARGQGPGVVGTVMVYLDPSAGNVSWPEYMNFDWSGDGRICANNSTECISQGGGTPDIDGPSSVLTFGAFRGNDRVIHWREVFN